MEIYDFHYILYPKNMKHILILGAGMVSKPVVDYLLDNKFQVTLADADVSKAASVIGRREHGNAVALDAQNQNVVENLVKAHDIIVSLLPYAFHPTVAKQCIRHRKNMVTASYVKPEMQTLDKEAREAGIIILNELGLDPGIDHISAMKIIDNVHEKGGKIKEFYSFTGALVAPEAAGNPLRYKFTWAPQGVVAAANNDAQYLLQGKTIRLETEALFKNPINCDFPQIGKLEVYPNRDSLKYIDLYGIPETQSIYRGTFRYPGWCEIMDDITMF